jgi:Retron-type reverse transcriptase
MSLERLSRRSRAASGPAKAGDGIRQNSHKDSGTSCGVVVDGMFRSGIQITEEISVGGSQRSIRNSSRDLTHDKVVGASGEVGVLHSSVDLWDSKTHGERREDTRLDAEERRVGHGDGPKGLPTPDKVRKLQTTLYRKAKADPSYRFWSLYGEILREDVLAEAWQRVSRNGGAAGVDGKTIDEIAATSEQLEKWLAELRAELRDKCYSPSPVRRVLIPKASGGQRPLGIPTVKDRVAQMAAYLVLMPIFEADFHPHSYGFRPKRRAQQAVEAIRDTLRKGKTEVIDADLSKYFDTIPHSSLLRQLAKRISDGAVLSLIKQWLKAPVVEEREDGRRVCIGNRCGTPQGGVISPLLANVYLNPLDHAVNQCAERPTLIRYADDFVILCRPGQGERLQARLHRWLNARGLELNTEKTRRFRVHHESLDFLGFTTLWRDSKSERTKPYWHVQPSRQSQRRLRQSLKEMTHRRTHQVETAVLVGHINRLVRGWGNYFYHGNCSTVFSRTNEYARERLRIWLCRKHNGFISCRHRHYPARRLHEQYGLYQLPLTAPWKRPT